MSQANTRKVSDSMGEMEVPENALYGAQTQRAVDNFPISGLPMPRQFIQAMGWVKKACALSNQALGDMDTTKASAISKAADKVAGGELDPHFPIDVFQTGSGTSTNMNTNEVIARYATIEAGLEIHPNDDVNMGQSSNDIIPTAIHVSAAYQTQNQLLPALQTLKKIIDAKAESLKNVTKTGRTHLMDAMPVTMGQELSGWSQQIQNGIVRIKSAMTDVLKLAIGGTAVGTGINAHPDFSQQVVTALAKETQLPFQTSPNCFESLSAQDAIVALSGQIRVLAVSLMKIANDLRWMNSGPLAGIGEIYLPALQPGSSIMPGKVNPVICESTMMACAQVIGNDTAIAVSGQHGNFQLNVMLPVIAYNILQSIQLIANTSTVLAEKAIAGFTINETNINEKLSRNPILVTALNPVIGYELGAKIAKTAYAENRPLLEVALEMTDLSESEIKSYLDPFVLTKGGLVDH
tara:strand:+ start:26603 stop:27994 length:1392 start_codon:yes stop_codon:yes gene_type:complete